MSWAILISYQPYVCIFLAFVCFNFLELFLYIFFKLFEFFDEVYACPGIEIGLIVQIVYTFVVRSRYVDSFC